MKKSLTNERKERLAALLRLSHDLGNPARPLSILGEGNTSTRLTHGTFLVKASGSSLGSLSKQDVVECKAGVLLPLLDKANLPDREVDGALMESRVDARAKKPSVEALFHAWFLTLPGIEFVGHTHAPCVNGVLCSPRARELTSRRCFVVQSSGDHASSDAARSRPGPARLPSDPRSALV